MIIVYCIFIPILLFISGFAKAVMDLSDEGKIKFKPSRYWIKAMSSPDKGWKGELNVYFLNNPIGGLAGLKSQIAL